MNTINPMVAFNIIAAIIEIICGVYACSLSNAAKCQEKRLLLKSSLSILKKALAQATLLKHYASRKKKHDRKKIRRLVSDQIGLLNSACEILQPQYKQICLLIEAAVAELSKLLIKDGEYDIEAINAFESTLQDAIDSVKTKISRLERRLPFP